MIRKLLLPAVAIALLGGCMTSGYHYRQDRGDYYYGEPSTDYRYYGSPYGGYYGYPGYSRYPYGYGGFYRHPYYYNDPYNGYPYYPYRPRPPVVVVPRPDDTTPPPVVDRDNSDRRPPWRNLDNLRRDPPRGVEPQPSLPTRAAVTPPPMRAVRPDGDRGSRSEQVIRRARDKERVREVEP